MSQPNTASILFVNGRIRVAEALDAPPVEWLEVRDGRTVASGVGVAPERDVRLYDLRGHTLAPAFTDAHVHLAWLATALLGPDLSACDSPGAVLDAIAAWRGPGRGANDAWIVGTGFDESPWRDNRLPTRAELDRLHPQRPVLLQRACGHVGVANTAALAFASDGPHTDRDSGWLAEDDLYVLNDLVRPSVDTFVAAMPAVVTLLHRHGITAVHDVSDPTMVMALGRCPTLPIRVTCSIPARALEIAAAAATAPATNAAAGAPLRAGSGRVSTRAVFFAQHGLAAMPLGGPDAMFEVLGVKIFTDGSLGARTAWLRAPYADAPATHGSALYREPALAQLVQRTHDAGLQLMVHAIGDAALDQVLGVLEPVAAHGNPLQHRVEHIEVSPPDIVARFARSGLWACMQPNFAARWSQPGAMNAQRLGSARLEHCNAYRTLLDAGIPIAFGSDCMPLGPLGGLHGAIAHPIASERLSRADAWRLYSRAGRMLARATAAPAADGAIAAPPSDADFVVLDADPIDVADWRTLGVVATVQRGRVVWERGSD